MGVAGGGVKIAEQVAGQLPIDLVAGFAPAYKNTATQTNSYWSFKSIMGRQSDQLWKCTDNSGKFAGLVTTNALAYSDGPPSFDSNAGDLEYKVASPHFEANGTVAAGSYDLSIRSDVARCLYKFTSAPIKATISITNDDGNNQIATTVVNEKNGWLYLSAKGFTFSSPKINVKLSQDAPVVQNSPAKKATVKTIKCKKGSTTKLVTSTSCPSGFKKA